MGLENIDAVLADVKNEVIQFSVLAGFKTAILSIIVEPGG